MLAAAAAAWAGPTRAVQCRSGAPARPPQASCRQQGGEAAKHSSMLAPGPSTPAPASSAGAVWGPCGSRSWVVWKPFVLRGARPLQDHAEPFPILDCQLAVPGLPHCDYVAATFLAYAVKTGMPARTLLGVGRHVWDGMQLHQGPAAPPYYARGPDFFPLGALGFCEALLASSQLPTRLSHADWRRLRPALEQVAACRGLPQEAALQQLGAALGDHIHLSPGALGIVYVRLPGRMRRALGPPVVITEEMLASPKALTAALDAAAELVWEAGEGAYVGSSAQKLRVAAGADLPAALLRQRVGAAAHARHRVVLICEAANAQLPLRLAEQHVINRSCREPGLPRLKNEVPLVYLQKLSGA